MDNEIGKGQSKKEWQHSIEASRTIFFLNKNLVRVVHSNRASNIVYLYNYAQDKDQSMLLSDFRKHRKRAFTIGNTIKIFRKSRIQFERLIKAQLIPPPTGATLNGERKWQKMSYYSEDDLFNIREGMCNIHVGRPRKDGQITIGKNVPTEKDLRSLIGDAIMLYTQTKDGEFIPVWAEETW
jgi:hypothetical protein